MKIAFLVPTTSKDRKWDNFNDSYLNQILLPSINNLSYSFDIEVYIGYDYDDILFTNIELPEKYNKISLKWFCMNENYKGKPCHIWNTLAEMALLDNHSYLQVCGDDISFDNRSEWLGIFIKLLKGNNNIGYVSGWSNNDNIPTQFLFHKTHIDIFGWIFPPAIHNWYCDDFIYGLYKDKGIWIKKYHHLNIGGSPRYIPNNDKELCKKLIKKFRKKLNL
jgi:hypothetical protein